MLEGRRVVLLTMRRRRMGKQDHNSPIKAAYHSLLSDLLIDWTRLGEDAERVKHHIPDAGCYWPRPQSFAPGLGKHLAFLFAIATWNTNCGARTRFGTAWWRMPIMYL